MKNKFIVFALSALMVFLTNEFAFAEEAEEIPQTESTQIEKIVKEEPEQEVQEETKEEPTQKIEQKTEAKEASTVKEEKEVKEEIEYPFAVEYIFKYRDGSGQYTQAQYWNNKVYNANDVFTNTKKMELCYNNYIKKNLKVKINGRLYEYAGYLTTTDRSTTVKTINATAGNFDTLHMYGKDYKKATTVVFEAQYKPVETFTFTADYSDKIANGGGGESHVDDGIVGYQHTFKTPADIPNNYEFVYWEDISNCSLIYWVTDENKYEDNKITYTEGEKIGVKPDTVTVNTTATICAVYQPIVTVNYYDEDGTYIGSTTGKEVDIYGSQAAPKKAGKFLGWYENEELVTEGEVKSLPLTKVEVPTEFDVYAKYEPAPAPKPPTPTPTPGPDKPGTTVAKVDTETIVYGYGDNTEPIAKTHTITSTNPPLIASKPTGAWAFINLLTVILNFALGILLMLMVIINKAKEDETIQIKNKMFLRIGTLVIAIISAIVFFLTENMALPMVWIDSWTVLMVCIFILNLFIATLVRREKHYN